MPVHYQKGTQDAAAFVFSCPGSREKKAGHPAAGVTGANLNALLRALCECFGREDLTRDRITIANAWREVESEALTGRSEASDAEILNEKNIEDLASELAHVREFIVFCGDKARLAAGELEKRGLLPHKPRLLFVEHLGTRGLNKIRKDISGSPIESAEKQVNDGANRPLRKIQRENTAKRVAVIAKALATDFE